MKELKLTIPLEPPSGNHYRTIPWSNEDLTWLAENYSSVGLKECSAKLSRSNASIRTKASKMGLKQDRNSPFFQEWQDKAASSKMGRKRPEQSLLMANLHRSGKLKRSAEVNKRIGENISQVWKIKGHPRGALGMKHTDEAKARMSQATSATWAAMTEDQKSSQVLKMMRTRVVNGLVRTQPSGRSWKAGWREIGGQRAYFRSRWEANYARYLEWMRQRGEIVSWEHEPETFWFEGIKRGCVSYLPDFRVVDVDGTSYHEVKGWMDSASVTKIKRMRIYHPKVRLVVADSKIYAQLERSLSTLIEGWETK